jgi:FOG: PAS/PAC domain
MTGKKNGLREAILKGIAILPGAFPLLVCTAQAAQTDGKSDPSPWAAVFGIGFIAVLAVLLFALSRLKKRRRMLAETNDRREYLQGLLDSIPNGIVAFVRNPDDTLTVNYLNDGFYRMLLIPKERSREPEADFKSALYPGDELLLRAEMHRSRTEHDNFYSTFRLKNQNGKYIWVTLQAAPAGRDTDQPAYYGAFTNMDDMKHVQEQLEESSASLRTAMSHAGMCYWEYDPEEHISLQDEKSQIELNLPEMMHDYPESLFALGVIPQEDIPIYKDAVRKIDVGAVESSCEVRNILTGGGSRWVRVQMTSIYGQDGERLKVLGTATDITEQRNAAVEYERQLAQVRSALSDPLVFFRVNLTKNYYSSAESAHEELVKTENRSADSLFEAIYSRAVTEEEKEAFKARFGRMELLEAFKRGETARTVDRRCRYGGKIHWVSVRTFIGRSPTTGDVETLIYSFNIDEEHYTEELLSTVAKNHHEQLLRINLAENQLQKFDPDRHQFGEQVISDAAAYLETFIRTHYAGDDLENFLRANSFEEVRRQLEKSDSYIQYATFRNEDGRLRRLELVNSWIDRDQQLVCSTLTDITGAFESERACCRKLLQEQREDPASSAGE